MNHEAVKQALLAAQHELTTLHNLTVTDNVESGRVWVADTSHILKLISDALNEF